jgi:hypothetical protein
VGRFFWRVRFANVLSSLGNRSGGLGVSSMYVARAVYLLGVTILMLLFANFFFLSPYLNPFSIIRAPTPSFIAGVTTIITFAAAAAFFRCAAHKSAHVQRIFMATFEFNVQFLAYFAGTPSFILFVVETFFFFMFPRVWALLLTVFAFVFYFSVFGRLAASSRLAAMLSVSSAALIVFLLLLFFLRFAPAGVLVH